MEKAVKSATTLANLGVVKKAKPFVVSNVPQGHYPSYFMDLKYKRNKWDYLLLVVAMGFIVVAVLLK